MSTGSPSAAQYAHVPRMTDLSARLRAGESLDDLAQAYDVPVDYLTRRLNEGGWQSTGQKMHKPWPARPNNQPAPRAPEWMDDAACIGLDPGFFFLDDDAPTKSAAPAKKICAGCPVRRNCLAYAMDNQDTHGIWGGLTYTERQATGRERRRAAR